MARRRTTGRTVLITGGAGGIGRALARRLLAEGNRVVLCGRSADRLAAARADLPGVATVVCDVADRASVDALGRFLEEHFPELDTVVNNAALNHPLDVHDPDAAERIEAELMVNVMGTVNVSTRLLPLLEARPDAVLAVVTSGIAYAPAPDVPGYSASKAALHSLARSLRHTLRNTSVQVVEIVPPAVDTDMIRDLDCKKMTVDQVTDKVLRGLAAGRTEIRMGQTHLSYRLNRLSPRAAEMLIRGSFD
jgi:uncharacterized oxidoreductase